MDDNLRILVDDYDALLFFFIVMILCILLIPMHMLSGYHIGLAVARRNVLHEEISFPKLMIPKHGRHRRLGLLPCWRHDHTFSLGQPISFHHHRSWVRLQILQGLAQIIKGVGFGGGDFAPHHQPA